MQAVPVIDASKNKPRKRMTVSQILRASEMSKEVLQSYLASDEESSHAEADVSAVSTVTEANTSSDNGSRKLRKIHRKFQEVLPDRATPRWWNKSENQIPPLKSKRKLFLHTSKENIRTKPLSSCENISRMYSAVMPKKSKQENYKLIVPNVEVKRRNEREKVLHENVLSDTNTWNSHITYRTSMESDKRNETLKGIPVEVSHREDDRVAWESNRKKIEEHQLDFRRKANILDKNQTLSLKSHKVKHIISGDEIGDMRRGGKKLKIDNEREEFEEEQHGARRKINAFDKERIKYVMDRRSEKRTVEEPSAVEERINNDVAPGTMLHPSALHLQFQAEMNRLESIEEYGQHLTAIQTIFAENIKAKRQSMSTQKNEEIGKDKEIEVKPHTVEISVQTTDFIDTNLILPSGQTREDAVYHSSVHAQTPYANKHHQSSIDTTRNVHSNKMENSTQTEGFRETRQKENILLNSGNKHTEITAEDRGVSQNDCREINIKECSSIKSTQNVTRRPVKVSEVLQETYETRRTIAHAMEMDDVKRSLRRDEELADMNRRFKMWDVEHLKEMNRIAREDNWLFQRTMLEGSSIWSTQTLVQSRILPTSRIVELEKCN
ncbi:hypothetical protein L9F63_013243 [Diploptera punctata]|uniref:Uncharacterized protein n=1 Tax=Diploptera punctata TaxID=6984 RepID=A0AAD8ABE5_DIPPU|nr:hypothetical protein L9F63_013243 [Diploptera punctata]